MNDKIYIQRALIGLFFLAACSGWYFAIRAGSDLDIYWGQLNWTQRLLSLELQETQVRREAQQTVRALFESMEACACTGDVGRQKELWSAFLSLLEKEEMLAGQIDQILKEQ